MATLELQYLVPDQTVWGRKEGEKPGKESGFFKLGESPHQNIAILLPTSFISH
jgi:hypothetical protein